MNDRKSGLSGFSGEAADTGARPARVWRDNMVSARRTDAAIAQFACPNKPMTGRIEALKETIHYELGHAYQTRLPTLKPVTASRSSSG